MRTPQQIENLRKYFGTRYPVFLITDEEVDAMADRFQDQLNDMFGTYSWTVKVQLCDEPEERWYDTESEPKSPYCTYKEMEGKCNELLKKYPKIRAIRIATFMKGKNVEFFFERSRQ